MPRHWVFQTDNTTREQRNSWAFLYCAWLVANGACRTVDQLFYRVGHTHNEVDQRFWVIGSALAKEATLQTPGDSVLKSSNSAFWVFSMHNNTITKNKDVNVRLQLYKSWNCCFYWSERYTRDHHLEHSVPSLLQEFRDCILKIPGASGRKLHCEIVDDVLDWSQFLSAADKHLSGLAIVLQMESVNHAFRFMPRSDLKNHKGFEPRQSIQLIMELGLCHDWLLLPGLLFCFIHAKLHVSSTWSVKR